MLSHIPSPVWRLYSQGGFSVNSSLERTSKVHASARAVSARSGWLHNKGRQRAAMEKQITGRHGSSTEMASPLRRGSPGLPAARSPASSGRGQRGRGERFPRPARRRQAGGYPHLRCNVLRECWMYVKMRVNRCLISKGRTWCGICITTNLKC